MIAMLFMMSVVMLTGCAAQQQGQRPPGGRSQASAEDLHAYLENVQPEAVAHVRFKLPLRWRYLNDYFLIMETRDGPHLVEMVSECSDLRPGFYNLDMADVRARTGVIRVHDTIRRCRIKNFYKLPEVDAVETSNDDGSD